MRYAKISEPIESSEYGAKAYWLSWLDTEGFNVPPALFLPAVTVGQAESMISQVFADKVFLDDLDDLLDANGNYAVAIRSSGLSEDGAISSMAGHFKSFVGTFSLAGVMENVRKVIQSLVVDRNPSGRMGVIIQKMIKPEFSGVAFSSNPLTGSKTEVVVSVIQGFGANLVSGMEAGEDIVISENDGAVSVPAYSIPLDFQALLELHRISKAIEQKQQTPVDIEWCVEEGSGVISVVQTRPLTGHRFDFLGVLPVTVQNRHLVPGSVMSSDKVRLRLLAEENSILMSRAFLVLLDDREANIFLDLSEVGSDPSCFGYSVVLIYPTKISGKIIREFAKKEREKQKNVFRSCQRYRIRQYCDSTELEAAIRSIGDRCLSLNWTCALIIQEIYEPEYTGIVKGIADGFVIEVARGHFVPKGVVTTSRYVLDTERRVLSINEPISANVYRIVEGKVLIEDLNESLKVPEEELASIVDSFDPILTRQESALEFGMLLRPNGTRVSYLIDLVDEKSQSPIDSKLISEGVISIGRRTGTLLRVERNESSTSSLELHYHDESSETPRRKEDTIFVCRSPDIALLPLLAEYDSTRIGFVFEQGSTLAHFSIILRERDIPAIVLHSKFTLEAGSTATLDAETPGLLPVQRIKMNT